MASKSTNLGVWFEPLECRLLLDAILEDRFEPNDSWSTPTDLYTLGSRTEADLTVHAAFNSDYYTFTTAATGTATIDLLFNNAEGDLQMDLHDAPGPPGQIASSHTHTDNEQIVYDVTAGQMYYIVVWGYFGATSPNYTLSLNSPAPPPDRFEPNDSWSTATDLGTLGSRTEADLNIHERFNIDYFRFTAAATGSATIDLLFEDDMGNLQLDLYDSPGPPGQVAWSHSDTDNEQIVYDVTAGQMYYVMVWGSWGTLSADYTLSVDSPAPPADRFEPNDSWATATDLGTLGSRTEADLNIHERFNIDYFRFTAAATGSATIDLLFEDDMGNLQLDLYDSPGPPGQVAWSHSDTDNEQIVYDVTAGQMYYVMVWGSWGTLSADYTLSVDSPAPPADRFEPNDSWATATDLGTLGSRTEADLNIHEWANVDYYRFTAADSGSATIDLLFDDDMGDLQLDLHDAPIPPAVVAWSHSDTDNEQIVYDVTAGQTYYVVVWGYWGTLSPNYTLSVNSPAPPADRFEPNDSWSNATNFGTMYSCIEAGLSLHDEYDVDYYEFTAGRSGRMDVLLQFDHAAGDINLAMYNGGGSPIGESNTTTDTEHLWVTVTTGQLYYVKAYRSSGTTGQTYQMVIAPPGDANFDGVVSLSDLGILATHWGSTTATGPEQGDFSSDGNTDLSDLGILATWWGTGTQALAGRQEAHLAEPLAIEAVAQDPLEGASPLSTTRIEQPAPSPITSSDVVQWRDRTRSAFHSQRETSPSPRRWASLDAILPQTAELDVLDVLGLPRLTRAL